jgi:branched-subunit amino acid ABC-type transport system permease component
MFAFAQPVLDGLINGSLYALVALGLTLAFGIARFANVAHGDFVTLGAYTTLWAVQAAGLGLLPATLVGVVASLTTGLLVAWLVYRPLARRARIASVIASIGVALVIRHMLIFFAGTQQYSFPLPIRRASQILGLRMTPKDATILAVVLLLMLALHLGLQRTRMGKDMRAVSDDAALARVAGIRVDRVILAMWVWSLILAAVAGVLLGVKTVLTPYMGWDMLLSAFAAAILGGIGNPYGAMAGGLLMGMAEELTTLVLPPAYRTAVAFLLMTGVLLVRPVGIFGTRVEVR